MAIEHELIDAKVLTELTRKARKAVDIKDDVNFILERCKQAANNGLYYCCVDFNELSRQYNPTKTENNYIWISALRDHIEQLGLSMTNHSCNNSFYTIRWGK